MKHSERGGKCEPDVKAMSGLADERRNRPN
jgi:hypothetical protein